MREVVGICVRVCARAWIRARECVRVRVRLCVRARASAWCGWVWEYAGFCAQAWLVWVVWVCVHARVCGQLCESSWVRVSGCMRVCHQHPPI